MASPAVAEGAARGTEAPGRTHEPRRDQISGPLLQACPEGNSDDDVALTLGVRPPTRV